MSASKKDFNGHDKLPNQKKKRAPRRKPQQEGTLAIIDRYLLARVRVTLNGEVIWITALEAIMYQLIKKERAGDIRAGRVLMGYEDLANRSTAKRLELKFDDSLTKDPEESGDG
jgi:hypothetical protein